MTSLDDLDRNVNDVVVRDKTFQGGGRESDTDGHGDGVEEGNVDLDLDLMSE